MASLARKLRALDAPADYVSSFDLQNDDNFQHLIIWLEDQKIRHYKIEDRENLRAKDKKIFTSAFQKYLKDLKSPFNDSNRAVVADWLLGLAVNLMYEDDAEKFRKCRASKLLQTPSCKLEGDNPLENLDLEDPSVKPAVMSIASLLNIPPHQDHRQVLKAICILMKEKFPKSDMPATGTSGTSAPADKIGLDTMELGFTTGDYVTDEAVKILRLLHLKNLREQQTKINEALVSVQKVTANPKTDQKLGKVGR